MRPLTRFIIVFAIALLSDALLIFGGASFGRLNVPETTAGASDYGVWVGLPVIAGIVMAWIGRGVGFVGKMVDASERGGGSGVGNGSTANSAIRKPSTKKLGREAGRLAEAGDTDAARHLLEAADKLLGKEVKQ